jgi:hypothetical protein
MPLAMPAAREPVHTRTIECRGFERDDGMIDVDGVLIDVKAHEIKSNWRGTLEPGTPIHHMQARLTIDTDRVIRHVEVATDASPFPECGEAPAVFQRLVGVSVEKGFSRKLRELLQRVESCTHHETLLNAMATVALHTFSSTRRLQKLSGMEAFGTATDSRPPLLDSCRGYRADSSVIRQYFPQHFAAAADPSEVK